MNILRQIQAHRNLRLLKAHWNAQGIAAAGPASAVDIAAFENTFGVVLPEDFRVYFRELNGMALGHDGAMDAEMISFWTLADIQRDHLEHALDPPTLFGFGDWSVDCCTYAIALSANAKAEAPVCLVCGPPVRVADSFTDFVAAYLRNDQRALYGVGI